MKHFKVFQTYEKYEENFGSENFSRPNLSYCKDENKVHFYKNFTKVKFNGVNAKIEQRYTYLKLGTSVIIQVNIEPDYYVTNAQILMSGKDITSTAWNQLLEKIEINNVKDNIIINITAEQISTPKAYLTSGTMMQGQTVTINAYSNLSNEDENIYKWLEITSSHNNSTMPQNLKFVENSGIKYDNYAIDLSPSEITCVENSGLDCWVGVRNTDDFALPVGNKCYCSFKLQDIVGDVGKYLIQVKSSFMSKQNLYLNLNTISIVNILPYERIIFDENNEGFPKINNKLEQIDITVNKVINANEWTPICLPVDISTRADFEAIFGSDVEIAEFIDVSWGSNSLNPSSNVNITDPNADLVINYKTYTGNKYDSQSHSDVSIIPYIYKCDPYYIIKCSTDITEIELDNILIKDIDFNENNSYYEFDNGQIGSRRIVYGSIYGAFHKHNINENDIILNEKTFKLSDGNNTQVNAYNTYIFVDKINNAFNGDIKLSIDNVIIDGYSKN